jgi:hypothetical protein
MAKIMEDKIIKQKGAAHYKIIKDGKEIGDLYQVYDIAHSEIINIIGGDYQLQLQERNTATERNKHKGIHDLLYSMGKQKELEEQERTLKQDIKDNRTQINNLFMSITSK